MTREPAKGRRLGRILDGLTMDGRENGHVFGKWSWNQLFQCWEIRCLKEQCDVSVSVTRDAEMTVGGKGLMKQCCGVWGIDRHVL